MSFNYILGPDGSIDWNLAQNGSSNRVAQPVGHLGSFFAPDCNIATVYLVALNVFSTLPTRGESKGKRLYELDCLEKQRTGSGLTAGGARSMPPLGRACLETSASTVILWSFVITLEGIQRVFAYRIHLMPRYFPFFPQSPDLNFHSSLICSPASHHSTALSVLSHTPSPLSSV